jgi:hypothetical protein
MSEFRTIYGQAAVLVVLEINLGRVRLYRALFQTPSSFSYWASNVPVFASTIFTRSGRFLESPWDISSVSSSKMLSHGQVIRWPAPVTRTRSPFGEISITPLAFCFTLVASEIWIVASCLPGMGTLAALRSATLSAA